MTYLEVEKAYWEERTKPPSINQKGRRKGGGGGAEHREKTKGEKRVLFCKHNRRTKGG